MTSDDQNTNGEIILVLDFGSQYTQLLAQRVRENQTYCEIIPCDATAQEIAARKPIGIILSGGPSSVYDETAPKIDPEIYKLGVPILGVCYGMQLTCKLFGAAVESAERREYGPAELTVSDAGRATPLFEGLSETSQVWMSHGDQATRMSEDFETLASTSTCPNAAVRMRSIPFYGIQFHPEVTHTAQGRELLTNFVVKICRSSRKWTMKNFVATAIEKIRAKVGKERVICGLSGGVDSAVVAALISRAIGNQLTCICVDNGMMRKNEIENVAKVFRENFDVNLVIANAEERFLSLLAGVDDPQQKRKIIGKTFIDVFSVEAKKIDGAKFLAQGTIYPDVIESGKGDSAVIKSHHNVGGLPDVISFDEIVEPLRELFKDEVREAGTQLGIPRELVWRQPFPGPGLAIRVIGDLTKEKLDLLREVDFVFRDEIAKAGLSREIWQYFAVLTGMRSVGVMGDERTYDYTVALRAVTSVDGMTADWARIPFDVLESISGRIISEVKHVNRIVYDITSKPPATIEWE